MRALRLYSPEHYCEATLRTQRDEFAFNLDDSALRDEVYGLLAVAARRYQIDVFAFHFLSNHYHGLYGYRSHVHLASFFAYFHANLARLLHRKNGTHGTVWGALKTHQVPTDEASVGRRIRYIMGQAVAAGLVAHPAHFEGPSSVQAMLTDGVLRGRRFDATQRCRDAARLVGGARNDETYVTARQLQLAVPACWRDLSEAALRDLYKAMADGLAHEVVHSNGPAQHQDPGQCLNNEISRKSPAHPQRATGRVRPKPGSEAFNRPRPPRLLSANQASAAAYEASYTEAVTAYHLAKATWAHGSRWRNGGLRSARFQLPPWMFAGTLPLLLAAIA